MRITYHPSAQKDVNRILKHYDGKSRKLGDEFWQELTSCIKATAETRDTRMSLDVLFAA